MHYTLCHFCSLKFEIATFCFYKTVLTENVTCRNMFIPRVQRLMVLGNFHCRGVPLIWFEVVPGVHAVGAEEVVWMFFFFFFFFFLLLSILSLFSASLGYGLVKTDMLSQRALKPKTTNQRLLPTVIGRLSLTVLTKPIRANLSEVESVTRIYGILYTPGRNPQLRLLRSSHMSSILAEFQQFRILLPSHLGFIRNAHN